MKTKKWFRSIAFVSVCSIWILPCGVIRGQTAAVPVFSDDFQGTLEQKWMAHGKPAGPDPDASDVTGAYYSIVSDTGNVFGKGPGHLVLLLHDFSKTKQVNLVAQNAFQLQVLTVSFDFYQAPDPSGGPFIVRLGTGANGDKEKAFSLYLDHGKMHNDLGAYSLGVKHHLDLVANNSTAAVTYAGTLSLPPQKYDVWIDGAPVLTGESIDFAANLKDTTQLSSLSFLTYQAVSDHVEIMIDGVSVTEGATVMPKTPGSAPAIPSAAPTTNTP